MQTQQQNLILILIRLDLNFNDTNRLLNHCLHKRKKKTSMNLSRSFLSERVKFGYQYQKLRQRASGSKKKKAKNNQNERCCGAGNELMRIAKNTIQ